MIPLNTTWDTVLMLLIAGGVGLIGGVAAGLLEVRRADTSSAKSKFSPWKFGGSIILGGIAAVAILYFFPPEESVESAGAVVNQYKLTRLVAFALIVGSAGTSFMLSMQARTRAAVATQLAETKEETATETIGGFETQVPIIAETGLKTTTPVLRNALEVAREGKRSKKVSKGFVDKVIEDMSREVKKSVEDQIGPLVAAAQKTVQAAGPDLEGSQSSGEKTT